VLEANQALLQTAFGDRYCKIDGAVQSFDHDLALRLVKEASAAR